MSLLTNIVEVDWLTVHQRVVNESPYTGRRQHSTLRYHRWEFTVQYATTKGDVALAKRAALAALRGGDVSFDFRDPSLATPQSGYTGSGLVNGDSTGYTLTVDGLTPSTLVLKAGDPFSVQIDSQWQLFTAAANATTSSGGAVSISLNNPIRGTAPDGATVRISDWLVTVTLDTDVQFKIDKNGLLKLPPIKFVEDF